MAGEIFNFENRPKDKKRKARKQEKKWAKRIGGKVQPASGALWIGKGDVKEYGNTVISNMLWDNKQTTQKGYRITTDFWEEFRKKALLAEGCSPGLQIEFYHNNPSLPNPLRLVVLEEEDYLALRNALEKGKEGSGEKSQ